MRRLQARDFIRRYRMMHFEMNWSMPKLSALVSLMRRELNRGGW